jgi:ergothioneine biosynthesis protein EgtC
MCRLMLYLGPETRLSSLIIEPTHSLIRQSTHSREREEPLNGDGFGIGWYSPDHTTEPAVFRSITPAWNNRNLHNIARVVASDCVLAHVRAATQSSGVNEANCHPFRWRQFLCMHNGDVGDFRLVRRRLLAAVCDEAFGNVYGSTDSEHFFALFIDSLLDSEESDPALRMARALARTISRTLELVHEAGSDSASYLNVAIADGDRAVISRFTDDADGAPESLYYFMGELYPVLHAKRRSNAGHPVIVSSERLTADEGWTEVPAGQIIILRRDRAPEFIDALTGEARTAPVVAGSASRAAPRVNDSRGGRAPRAARGSPR